MAENPKEKTMNNPAACCGVIHLRRSIQFRLRPVIRPKVKDPFLCLFEENENCTLPENHAG